MRAVNLIPSDQRSGQSVGAGRSEGAAYALLGLLAAVAVLAVLYGKAHRDISGREHETAKLTVEASRATTEASALSSYTSFVALRQSREQAVETLVDSRFDWAHAFHELGRVLTAQTSISSLTGSISAGTGSSSSSSAASSATSTPSASTASTSSAASPSPTTATAAASSVSSSTPPGSVPLFTLAGCATSQNAVAEMLQRLRLIDGVSSVNLQSSTKGGSSGGGGGAGACPQSDPAFTVGVTFDPLPSASAAQAAAKPGATNVSDTGAAK